VRQLFEKISAVAWSCPVVAIAALCVGVAVAVAMAVAHDHVDADLTCELIG